MTSDRLVPWFARGEMGVIFGSSDAPCNLNLSVPDEDHMVLYG